jgi:hypothetical protein
MAVSCRTGRKGRAQLNDASFWRGPIAKTGAVLRSPAYFDGPEASEHFRQIGADRQISRSADQVAALVQFERRAESAAFMTVGNGAPGRLTGD